MYITKQKHRYRKQTRDYQWERNWGWGGTGVWDSEIQTTTSKINNH